MFLTVFSFGNWLSGLFDYGIQRLAQLVEQ